MDWKPKGFEETWLAYKNLAFVCAFDVLQNQTWAEDAVSEAFLKILQHYDCLAAPTGAQTKKFVVVVTRNIALNLLRHYRRLCPLPPLEPETVGESGSEEGAVIRAAIRELPKEQRTALLLSCWCGFTAAETARIMGKPTARVQTLIRSAKQKLKKRLEGLL